MARSRLPVAGVLVATLAQLSLPALARAQDAPDAAHQHAMAPAADPAGLFSTREASGTSWVPDATPMYAWMHEARGWGLMVHGQAYAQALVESGEDHRSGRQAGGTSWLMAVARRRVGAARLGVRFMGSVDPWTVGGCGYPNLLATGEICDGDSLHDRQHPHDALMEIAGVYDRPVAGAVRWQVYAALAGEPALGPAGFPHRLSAFSNPIAPIAHHWLDSSHIAFGVVTTGVAGTRWKAEASAFNGREPDDRRAGLEFRALDSLSGRLTVLPTARLSLQVSAGRLREAEAALGATPPVDVARITASAMYQRDRGDGGHWTAMAAYGTNAEDEAVPDRGTIAQRTHAGLVEAAVVSRAGHTWFARAELAGKSAHDLHVHEALGQVFTVGKVQGGYVRALGSWRGLVPGIGATVAASVLPRALAPRYAGRVAPGAGVFLTLRPAVHRM